MTLAQQLERRAREDADRPAVFWRDRSWSWGELDREARALAGGLARRGVGRGDLVAILVPNVPPFITLYLALQKLGAAALPINLLLMPEEVGRILADARARALVWADVFTPLVAGLRDAGRTPELLVAVGSGAPAWSVPFDALLEGGAAAPVSPEPGETSTVLYKAGADGVPRGVRLSHRNLLHQGRMIRAGLHMTADDRTLLVLPLYHVFAVGVVLQSALVTGSSIILLERFDPDDVLRTLANLSATLFFGVPTMYALMLRQASRADYALPESLRTCICGAAPLPVEVAHRFEATFGARIVEGYGLTEAAGATAVNPPRGPVKLGTIGPAIPGNQMRVVDAAGKALPPGAPGEIIVRGDNVMEGYLGHADDAARAVVDGWLHTGDIGSVDEDGYFTLHARKHDLIIVGGENVYPREVENRLRELPGVRDAAVRGVAHAVMGEVVQAWVVREGGAQLDADAVADQLRGRLARFKVPRVVHFVDALPRGADGQVVRGELVPPPR